jgi:hypothetical protein
MTKVMLVIGAGVRGHGVRAVLRKWHNDREVIDIQPVLLYKAWGVVELGTSAGA